MIKFFNTLKIIHEFQFLTNGYKQLQYKFILLKPEYQKAVERCQTRTCHAGATPEYWIKHFYDLLEFDESVVIVNNTDMTAEDTADYILNEFC